MPDRQRKLDLFREMNRYDGRDEDWPSKEVFEHPRRTRANGWRKFHADRDCGRNELRFIENASTRPVREKYEYEIYCPRCGYCVPEQEVLFVGGDWWHESGWKHYGRSIDDLWLSDDRVLELGPDPDEDAFRRALDLTRIEREAGRGLFGASFGNNRLRECNTCGNDVPLVFDGKCRACYDGEWTDDMQSTVDSFGVSIRERNGSFKHRLERHVDPFSIKGRAFPEKILWRKNAEENVPRMVEVAQCLKDDADGHWEYVLVDLTNTSRWQYHEDDVVDLFYDTGLYNDEHPKGVMDERIREAWQHVCDHSFHEVHDSDTLEVTGEQCIKCRARRPLAGSAGGETE